MLDEAKNIFFPEGKSGYAKARELDLCKCSLGNFTGQPLPLDDPDFSFSQYLADNGLYASCVRFYLLTTLKDQDTLVNSNSSCGSGQFDQNLSTTTQTECGNDDAFDPRMDNEKVEFEKDASESLLYVDDKKRSILLEFCRHKISNYTSEVSSQFVIGWDHCYSAKSSKFLECEPNLYHPRDDNFTVSSITIDNNTYVKPVVDKDASQSENIMQDTYCFPMHDFQETDQPLILHEPNELHGYDLDNNLFVAVVTNFHNEVGVNYTWFMNDEVCADGSSHCVIRITSPGLYHCEIDYGDIKLTSNSVQVLKRDCLRYVCHFCKVKIQQVNFIMKNVQTLLVQ